MERVVLTKHLFWYAIFHLLVLVMWLIGAWADRSTLVVWLFPLLPLWVVLVTISNRTRMQHEQDVTVLPYMCYFWMDVVLTLILVFQGFLGGLLWSVFRIVWTWKVIDRLKAYRVWLKQDKIDLPS